jgi:hypothetical protein
MMKNCESIALIRLTAEPAGQDPVLGDPLLKRLDADTPIRRHAGTNPRAGNDLHLLLAARRFLILLGTNGGRDFLDSIKDGESGAE